MNNCVQILADSLPSGWEARRLKYLATYNDEVLPENTAPDTEIEYVEISDVSLESGIKKINPMKFEDASASARRRVRNGDVIISTVRTYLKAIAVVADASDRLVVSTGFCVIRPRLKMESGYFGWVAKSDCFVDAVVSRSTGVTYPTVKSVDIASLPVPLPRLDIQKRIADFLDERTALVDKFIAKKEQLLELLAEKRQALITRAVTKGFDSDAPMKPSGVDWLGDIPAHWEVVQLRRVASQVQTGRTPSSAGEDYFEAGAFNWFTPGDFGDGIILQRSAKKVRQDSVKDGILPEFSPESVLLVAIGSIGKVGVVSEPCSSNQQINSIKVREVVLPHFLAYFLMAHEEVVKSYANASTLGILNQDQTKSLLLAKPPLFEQEKIVAMAEQEMSQYSETSLRIKQSIALLNEYRSALITAAVTGQIESMQ